MNLLRKLFGRVKANNLWLGIFLATALFGFFDATYLAISHFTGSSLSCALFKGCDIVTSSAYSTFFGVPVALAGSLYYLAVFLGTIAAIDMRNALLLRGITYATAVGFVGSLYFLYLQLFVIHALCQYCILSLVACTVLFASSFVVRKYSSL